MKYPLLLLLSTVIICSCNNKDEVPHLKHNPKKTIVLCTFDTNKNDHRVTYAYRDIIDTVKVIVTDSSSGKIVSEKKHVLDTTYFIPIPDTVRNSKGKPDLDSLGKPKLAMFFPVIPNKYVIVDYNKEW